MRLSFCVYADRRDSSGIRFYIGKERRQHDLGYLTLGTDTFILGLAIPPRADRFIVDSYCPANNTKVSVDQRQDKHSLLPLHSENTFDRNHGVLCISTHPSTRYRATFHSLGSVTCVLSQDEVSGPSSFEIR